MISESICVPDVELRRRRQLTLIAFPRGRPEMQEGEREKKEASSWLPSIFVGKFERAEMKS